MIIGTLFVLRISRHTSKPSIFGNIKSKITKSGFSSAKTAKPAAKKAAKPAAKKEEK